MNFTNILQVLSDDLATVSDKDCEMPTKEVTKNEIYQSLQSFPSTKSPGPNGLNVEFYNFFFWHDVGDHLYFAVKYFFSNSNMSNAWGRSYITLISKKPNPKYIADFQPISLCNVSYKIISKILANRLKIVLPHLIGKEQCGFVSGRTPFDNIITLQKVVHSLNHEMNHPLRILIKFNIARVDTLSWNAILTTLTRMNFPGLWINRIKTYFNSASFFLYYQ